MFSGHWFYFWSGFALLGGPLLFLLALTVAYWRDKIVLTRATSRRRAEDYNAYAVRRGVPGGQFRAQAV